MNTDELIEQIHEANALRRAAESHVHKKRLWSIAVPAVAAAAILLLVFLPRGNEVQAAATTGIYCNSQCSPEDVIALIDNNINHIKEIQRL